MKIILNQIYFHLEIKCKILSEITKDYFNNIGMRKYLVDMIV